MSILINKSTKVIVQGITGSAGTFHAKACRDYGTRIVGGVTPGKGGTNVEGIPVFNTVKAAVQSTGADASLIFVPAPFAADAILEAADARIPLIVCITEGIPVLDMVKVKHSLPTDSILIGPNGPGLITPGECKVGIMPGPIHKQGRIGIVSRSGTLTYEAVGQLTARGIGQSTVVGIGGDPVQGLSFIDVLALFEADPGTDAVLMMGEIGGTAEEEAAAFHRKKMTKPLFAFVAGRTAPPGRRMGHAGAIIDGGQGTADDKRRALETAGAILIDSPSKMGETVERFLKQRQKDPNRSHA